MIAWDQHKRLAYVERTVKRKRLRIVKPPDLKVPFEDALSLPTRAVFMASDRG